MPETAALHLRRYAPSRLCEISTQTVISIIQNLGTILYGGSTRPLVS